ncbi:mitochondrial genome maintenance MGM101-domain-containing protein [Amanita rubescens]|nr:mitochondrial genome maintenance MGM101-domain-containing protein [Amanita rubescens]
MSSFPSSVLSSTRSAPERASNGHARCKSPETAPGLPPLAAPKSSTTRGHDINSDYVNPADSVFSGYYSTRAGSQVGLLYLPEIKYRRILNRAFGPGGWGLVPRSETFFGPKIVSQIVCFQSGIVLILILIASYIQPQEQRKKIG